MRLSLDAENREHLKRYFRLHPKSDYFFTPFQTRKNEGRWREPKYPSTSLQAINTQGFAGALLHIKNEKDWGWETGYLAFLASKLPKGQKLPLVDLAIWFERETRWDDDVTRADIARKFVGDFHLSDAELSTLFDATDLSSLTEEAAFESTPAKWDRIIEDFGIPVDVPREGGAILQFLEFSGIGPTKKLTFIPASRLNVITGDNGLGKTFLLDVAWWALTQEWAEEMIVPLEPVATPPQIKFSVATTADEKPAVTEFDAKGYRWKLLSPLSTVSGLVVYARVDGSFAVWDPANPQLVSKDACASFTREAVWNGGDGIEGLLRDWIRWQTRENEFPVFETFQKVIQRTKPPDIGELRVGSPTRVRGGSKEIPTLVHPYGRVPITYESAGIRRILTLAYLIVWAWEEHKLRAKDAGRREERQMVILLDEAEAHLHPKWQRVLLRALLGIAQDLHEELRIQYLIATHSPMVLASAESVWDEEIDRLFHLKLNANGKVSFEGVPFELRGTADSWLKSPSFDNLHPGSEAAEIAIRQAKNLISTPSPDVREIEVVTNHLADHIAADDPFWLRWIVFATEHGVKI
ncbi:AAA family ATPase [Trinickia soli]|nr:AAA family ATPase [Trinickia soli]CAB3688267.1 hypothetical protein LMG24076_02792 [Trinickia soli]